jgi:chemotaxis receptor (MCP) glutamine deamidase CheD
MKPAPVRDVTIYIGGMYVSAAPTLVRTTLGSCIAIALFDPVARVGGLNHFMLPEAAGVVTEPGRYGGYAMELLIGELQKIGGLRSRFLAKIFGGGHVLDTEPSEGSAPQRNISFARQFIEDEGFHITSLDVGGLLPRVVKFETTTGRAFVKRLGRPIASLTREEQTLRSRAPARELSNLEFF